MFMRITTKKLTQPRMLLDRQNKSVPRTDIKKAFLLECNLETERKNTHKNIDLGQVANKSKKKQKNSDSSPSINKMQFHVATISSQQKSQPKLAHKLQSERPKLVLNIGGTRSISNLGPMGFLNRDIDSYGTIGSPL